MQIKKMFIRYSLLGLLALQSALVCAQLTIEQGYVRGLPPGQPTTAAFMHLVNSGQVDITIVSASTNSAEKAEVHAHSHNNGMMSMHKVDSITVAAQSDFKLTPGEHHLMLINLHKPLREGDKVIIELATSTGEKITAQLPVRSVLNEHKY